MPKKAKGPRFQDVGQLPEKIETRNYTVNRTGLEHTSSNTVYFDCPFCKNEVKAYLWSLCGGGKRCDCGALFGSYGSGYHWKTTTEKKQND